ncbi:hypothetical protein FOA52_003626 [Chlamydomonas sp. UWO 241]|nr:hypothetical protein FOA52_003626 [Chlamydomonas sp. UWO 241]
MDAGAAWLVNDVLVLTVDVAEDRFQLGTGGVPCDVTLKLPCGAEVPAHAQLLQLASPFSTAPWRTCTAVPRSRAWTYILSDLYPQFDPPALTLSSVYTLLPVMHKYDFPKLLARLVGFIKGKIKALSHNAWGPANYIVLWLALSERLQLDELRELCLNKLRSMTRQQLQIAITMDVEADSVTGNKRRAVRKEVQQLGEELHDEIILTALATSA